MGAFPVKKTITFSIVIFLCTWNVHAATLYMGASATYTNLQSAMAAMNSGDTLIIKDGTYTGATNIIDNSHTPPAGTSGHYTTIQAEHPGYAIFDGGGVRIPLSFIDQAQASRYWAFDGLVFRNSSGASANITDRKSVV
jgi:hypothetical protein